MLAPLIFALALTQVPDKLAQEFKSPPAAARPWVYWYFMEGNISKQGIHNDLEAMKKAGIGGAIFLEVNIGIPKGPVKYMSPEWRSLVGYASKEADRLGMELGLGTGPGWCGAGGPWVKPEDAMQHLVSSKTNVTGPTVFDADLAKPEPRLPFFGLGSLNAKMTGDWKNYYQDEVVLAVPSGTASLTDLDHKSLVYRAPYSSQAGTPPRIAPDTKAEPAIDPAKVINLTDKFKNGHLNWNVPAGNWTILRFGRTLTGVTTRPAPDAGLGFETDKFRTDPIDHHLDQFIESIIQEVGPRHPGRGLTTLHFDSWEMSSQNWTKGFAAEFQKRRGYDPTPYLPVMAGNIIGSVDVSERFLWDLRQTAQELVVQNQLGEIRKRAKKYGLKVDVEPYDMNPTSDLYLGSAADVPMGEFWSKGFGYNTEYSVDEAVSIGHTNGYPIIGAESFTADDGDGWLQHPASMKEQGDWALAAGINRIAFHRYQHQPAENEFPGMTMGPYGVHWERTQTWWDMVGPYHEYITRSQDLLRKGHSVADILYLVPEGAPNVFTPPSDAKTGRFGDRREYGFDGVAPQTLVEKAKTKNGQIEFPGGSTYRVLVLPRVSSMTPQLLNKIKAIAEAGVTVIGNAPTTSPSLSNFPAVDNLVKSVAASFWSKVLPDPDANSAKTQGESLLTANWIWANIETDPTESASISTKSFTKTFDVPTKVTEATVSGTGDNEFTLTLNGKQVFSGTDFHKIEVKTVTDQIQLGTNTITLQVANTGDAPNPAGAIAALDLTLANGKTISIKTDESWQCDSQPAKVIGAFNMAPWNLTQSNLPIPEIYPTYESTAKILADKLRIPADLYSTVRLRYGHRKDGDTDIYFVANPTTDQFSGNPIFRVSGKQPELWDPLTGTTRDLPQFTESNGTTALHLNLEPLQSAFIVFRRPAERALGENFTPKHLIATIQTPWSVQFDPKFGGPTSPITLTELTDWRDLKGLAHYSGKAVYTTTFDAPNQITQISLGEVANIASVRINGTEIGVAWCTPWKLTIPKNLLKPTGNELVITVANLWVNRLIGDSGLPESQRITKTTWSPYNPKSPLVKSGLIGPVTLWR